MIKKSTKEDKKPRIKSDVIEQGRNVVRTKRKRS
jgi:hypothetical protein